jgi:regulator of protease activity HflC (stomatin/prohibitin superfamily)
VSLVTLRHTRHTPQNDSELGKITLDKTFEERETLNLAIVASINGAAEAWGLQCLRYEIKDITPPSGEVERRSGVE